MGLVVKKRSLTIDGRKTSISLEDPFWDALKEIAASKGMPVADLAAHIEKERVQANLSSAIRMYILAHYRSPAA